MVTAAAASARFWSRVRSWLSGPVLVPGFGPGFGRGPRRASRGDVRAAILSLLAESPSNGYGLIKTIAEKTDGAWRPSPGSIYPTLQQLVDEGLIAALSEGRGTEFTLTEAGRAYVAEHAEEMENAWNSGPEESGPGLPPEHRQADGRHPSVPQRCHGGTADSGPGEAGRNPPRALQDPGGLSAGAGLPEHGRHHSLPQVTLQALPGGPSPGLLAWTRVPAARRSVNRPLQIARAGSRNVPDSMARSGLKAAPISPNA